MSYESKEPRRAVRAIRIVALLAVLLPMACLDGAFIVEERFVARVVIVPDDVTLQMGVAETAQLDVVLEDADGKEISGRDVTWSSNRECVASVNQSGLVTAVADGTATITAESEGQTGTASITVETPSSAPVASVAVSPSSATLAVDATVQLDVVLEDADGHELSGRDVTWSSNGEGVASVDQTGLVTAVSEGTATITAESEGESGTASITVTTSAGGGGTTTANLKVAFIGDQGDGSNAVAVLELILSEGADMVLHQGDLDYNDDPDTWDAMITSVLGDDYPYFASVGNHDDSRWDGAGGYQEKLQQRLERIAGASCSGDLGVNSACTYQGLFFILSGVGTLGSDHESYIQQQLSGDGSTWRVCTWHKNQNAMQVGGKGNEVGWGAYETCRQLGAIIATGHEHSYSRTKTLTSTESQTVDPAWSERNSLRVDEGATFVFVSGLGGNGIRDQERCLPTTYPYGCNGEWASIYTTDQSANYGALFIEFHVDGDPRKARGYFKDIDGNVIDQFTVTSQVNE
jgi:hypothetical protein